MSREQDQVQEQRTRVLPFSSVHQRAGVSRRLAPEDVEPGQYVTVLVRHQRFWRFDCEREEPVSHGITSLPEQDDDGDQEAGGRAGAPMRVLAVSLPFVVARAIGVKRPDADAEDSSPRRARTLDLRQVELAEVGRDYARAFASASRPRPSSGDAGEGQGPAPPGAKTS
ncbi:MAG: hypothetical protein NCW75_07935 [Phycisphaera sp.]|nr:MAG: hypothetical protein NCW75_07935 [Phycisphaera sp.]